MRNNCYNSRHRQSDCIQRSFSHHVGWVLLWIIKMFRRKSNLGAFLASAKDVKPEARGDLLLHDTDLLLVHNKVVHGDE